MENSAAPARVDKLGRVYRTCAQLRAALLALGHPVKDVVRVQGRAIAVMEDGREVRVDQLHRTPESRRAEYLRNKETYTFTYQQRYADPAKRAAVMSRSNAAYAARVSAGLCTACGRDAALTARKCENCWWKGAARAHLGSARFADRMRAVFAGHHGRCYLTGRELTPGVDLSFDHVVPRSSGGASVMSVDNLAPCHVDANTAKNCMPLSVFVSLCADVVKTQQKQGDIR